MAGRNDPVSVVVPDTPSAVSVPTLVMLVCAACVTVNAVPDALPVTLPVNGPTNPVDVTVEAPTIAPLTFIPSLIWIAVESLV